MKIMPARSVRGTIRVPGDKSISHRAVMLSSLAGGISRLSGFSTARDCFTTVNAFRAMGVPIEESEENVLTVHGAGLHGLKAPKETLHMGNSGTTTRLLAGILAAQDFHSTLSGDASLNSRPMKRIITPLTAMGADIQSLEGNGCAPLRITGKPLRGTRYALPVASAQVKSCLLLAGLYADSPTTVTEPYASRDHTERMLPHFGAKLQKQGNSVTVFPCARLTAQNMEIPGDISTAAFFLTAALLLPGSRLTVRGVGVNPTRSGVLAVLNRMGAGLKAENRHSSGGEKLADITATCRPLRATDILPAEVPSLVDEIPVLAVAAAFAEGTSTFYGVGELRKKESDRLSALEEGLSRMGVTVKTTEDTMTVTGKKAPAGASVRTFADHRIAMSFAVAALAAAGETTLDNTDCAAISCPEFFPLLTALLV